MVDDKRGEKTERVLFTACVFIFFYMVLSIIFEMAGVGRVTSNETELNLCIVTAYAVFTRARRYGRGIRDQRMGEWFVIYWWILGCIVFSLGRYVGIEVPGELIPNIKQVTYVFFGSQAVKYLEGFHNKPKDTPPNKKE
ncbi:hypothetical protein A2331_05210 [Candidatus Falkowbacteria bacterium RIFOXYB2_FULL_34_18]|uniref:Uncharacterized protein n=1 Tax=Candidatus Falkowbacteria bacterium RIFOXYD2_FULL_34_120 TaxID=1798007 RepID=A0A1F5TNC4_9BACT|nr:MAG: hypothetical protein A2500_07035 [Candidatus Falkowbacteria bacterium RIFOXYC12_FULL_34_55]OGF28741.1 MAG: hypothetical protein A2331_05210 [Candidatus Falkowbacteria bacterium RIFOXYB2_FULL_34_18]OGF38106.1 MAG: hypothetical protein A2466_04390 [Candidatus Falkowbacteria bacterium RIFOXYC2_FULL_34_220]OGF38360.1 MAG: hypothetical protein A2515_06420 [Candidatus Falkowbacteria bacterium RIFOXYD12_FULL_34_57]OGF40347.1 MAG: hypothetical protein A2531_00680 [Candidatus Falkowbacteria bact